MFHSASICFEKIRQWGPTILIFLGTLGIIVGIGWSLYLASLNNPLLSTDAPTLLPSGILLAGTFCLGWGFYIKCNRNSNQNLSEYGHFMLGLAALITLPQTPEMLKHILNIEKAVSELSAIRENQDSESKILSSAPLKETKSPAETLDIIKGLVRSENGISGSSFKSFSSEENRIPFSGGESRSNVAEDSPSQPTYSQSDTYVFEKKAPIPGMAYLTPQKADKIIATLRANKFDKNMAEALVRENLEVWHPLGRPSRYQKHIKRE